MTAYESSAITSSAKTELLGVTMITKVDFEKRENTLSHATEFGDKENAICAAGFSPRLEARPIFSPEV